MAGGYLRTSCGRTLGQVRKHWAEPRSPKEGSFPIRAMLMLAQERTCQAPAAPTLGDRGGVRDGGAGLSRSQGFRKQLSRRWPGLNSPSAPPAGRAPCGPGERRAPAPGQPLEAGRGAQEQARRAHVPALPRGARYAPRPAQPRPPLSARFAPLPNSLLPFRAGHPLWPQLLLLGTTPLFTGEKAEALVSFQPQQERRSWSLSSASLGADGGGSGACPLGQGQLTFAHLTSSLRPETGAGAPR